MNTEERKYFSERTGKRDRIHISIRELTEFLSATSETFRDRGYLNEAMGSLKGGYPKVGQGKMGTDVSLYFYLKTGKRDIYPINLSRDYTKEELFDIIEILHDHVSVKEVHGSSYRKVGAQVTFRTEVNKYLRWFEGGWELTGEGYVCQLSDSGLGDLLKLKPEADDDDGKINPKIEAAIRLFRNRNSTPEEKRSAIRELGDVLEYLRDNRQLVLNSKDDGPLFQILNNYSIRHHNLQQKSEYDPSIYYDWMFYVFLSTVHAAIKLYSPKEKDAT